MVVNPVKRIVKNDICLVGEINQKSLHLENVPPKM